MGPPLKSYAQTARFSHASGAMLSSAIGSRGGMAEWSMAVVLKTTEPGRVPGVRIPLPPPIPLPSIGIGRVLQAHARCAFGTSRSARIPSGRLRCAATPQSALVRVRMAVVRVHDLHQVAGQLLDLSFP